MYWSRARHLASFGSIWIPRRPASRPSWRRSTPGRKRALPQVSLGSCTPAETNCAYGLATLQAGKESQAGSCWNILMHIEFPGFFDLQINGFGGVDFNSPLTTPGDVYRAIEQLRRRGVTRFLPTLGTSSFERFAKCAKTLSQTPHPAMVGL